MKPKVALLLPIFLLFLLAANAQALNDPSRFRIIGYYPLKSALTADATTIPFDKLTHVNLWFVNPDSAGNFKEDFSGLLAFIEAAHAHQVKVLLSIGGGSKQAQYQRLLQDDKRHLLVDSIVSLALRYQADGIDVDLEGSDIDAHYEAFIVELAASLRVHQKLLTAAIAVYYKDQLTDQALAQFDFVNVMSYDRTGPWRPEKPGPHATYAHAVEDLAYFGKVRALPKEKITLGVPFYGYGFGPALTSPAVSMNFEEIVTAFPGSHSVDQWEMPGGKTLYYNGIPTIRQKTALAKKNASGIMIWQLPGDAAGPYSLLEVIYNTAYGKSR
jgi:GH18 family chitinase